METQTQSIYTSRKEHQIQEDICNWSKDPKLISTIDTFMTWLIYQCWAVLLFWEEAFTCYCYTTKWNLYQSDSLIIPNKYNHPKTSSNLSTYCCWTYRGDKVGSPIPNTTNEVLHGVETGEGHHPYIQPPQHRPMCPTKHIRQIQGRSWEILNCCFMPQIRFIDWCTSNQKHGTRDFVKNSERWNLTNFKCHNWL